jgi:hypothetical protein
MPLANQNMQHCSSLQSRSLRGTYQIHVRRIHRPFDRQVQRCQGSDRGQRHFDGFRSQLCSQTGKGTVRFAWEWRL